MSANLAYLYTITSNASDIKHILLSLLVTCGISACPEVDMLCFWLTHVGYVSQMTEVTSPCDTSHTVSWQMSIKYVMQDLALMSNCQRWSSSQSWDKIKNKITVLSVRNLWNVGIETACVIRNLISCSLLSIYIWINGSGTSISCQPHNCQFRIPF